MVKVSPQDLGVVEHPFQMAMKMAYKFGGLGPNYVRSGMIPASTGVRQRIFLKFL